VKDFIMKKPRVTLARLLFCLLILTLCGCEGPQLRPLTADATILAFGDSLTYGTGAKRTESYPAILAELTGHRVINAGIPGEVSSNGLTRLPGALAEHQPQILILCHAGNDFLRRKNIQEAESNVRAMIALAREQGVEVVLIGVPQLGLFLDTAPFYEQIAKDFALPFAAFFIS
jgi:acyl-CoA thioesterase-1